MAVLICPTCSRMVTYSEVGEMPYRPFCSQRCKLVDLGRWLNEEFRISEELTDDPNDPDRGMRDDSTPID